MVRSGEGLFSPFVFGVLPVRVLLGRALQGEIAHAGGDAAAYPELERRQNEQVFAGGKPHADVVVTPVVRVEQCHRNHRNPAGHEG